MAAERALLLLLLLLLTKLLLLLLVVGLGVTGGHLLAGRRQRRRGGVGGAKVEFLAGGAVGFEEELEFVLLVPQRLDLGLQGTALVFEAFRLLRTSRCVH